MTAKEHYQIDAANTQLEQAILLFLDKQDYYSAATLAGAAEEIFGGRVKLLEIENAFNRVHARTKESLSPEELEAIKPDLDTKGPRNGVTAALNSIRNWLKHFSDSINDDMRYVDMEAEAIDLLERAVDSHRLLLEKSTPCIERFRKYAASRHSM